MATAKTDRPSKRAKEEPVTNWTGRYSQQKQDMSLDHLHNLTEYVGIKTPSITTEGQNWAIELYRQKDEKNLEKKPTLISEGYGNKQILGIKTLMGVIFTSALEQEIMKMFENTVARAIDEIIEEDRLRNETTIEEMLFGVLQTSYDEIRKENNNYKYVEVENHNTEILEQMFIDVTAAAFKEISIEQTMNNKNLDIIDITTEACLEQMFNDVIEAACAELSLEEMMTDKYITAIEGLKEAVERNQQMSNYAMVASEESGAEERGITQIVREDSESGESDMTLLPEDLDSEASDITLISNEELGKEACGTADHIDIIMDDIRVEIDILDGIKSEKVFLFTGIMGAATEEIRVDESEVKNYNAHMGGTLDEPKIAAELKQSVRGVMKKKGEEDCRKQKLFDEEEKSKTDTRVLVNTQSDTSLVNSKVLRCRDVETSKTDSSLLANVKTDEMNDKKEVFRTVMKLESKVLPVTENGTEKCDLLDELKTDYDAYDFLKAEATGGAMPSDLMDAVMKELLKEKARNIKTGDHFKQQRKTSESAENTKAETTEEAKEIRDNTRADNKNLGTKVSKAEKNNCISQEPYVILGKTNFEMMDETKQMLNDVLIAAGERPGGETEKTKNSRDIVKEPQTYTIKSDSAISESLDKGKPVESDGAEEVNEEIVNGLMKNIEIAKDGQKSYAVIDKTKVEIMDETKQILCDVIEVDSEREMVQLNKAQQNEGQECVISHNTDGYVKGENKLKETQETTLTDWTDKGYPYSEDELKRKTRLYVQDIIIVAAHRLREEERIAAEIEEASNDIDLQDFDEPEANIECSGQSGNTSTGSDDGKPETAESATINDSKPTEDTKEPATNYVSIPSESVKYEAGKQTPSTVNKKRISPHVEFVSDLIENMLNVGDEDEEKLESVDLSDETKEDEESDELFKDIDTLSMESIRSIREKQNIGRWKRFKKNLLKMCGWEKK